MGVVRIRKRETAGRRERGLFTFVEIMLATIILAMAATATAYWVETVGGLSRDASDQTLGGAVIQVVETLLLPLPFREPGTTAIGPEAGENLALFDDLDDFDGLVASPPFDGEKQTQTELAGWSVRIDVVCVDPVTLVETGASDMKRVAVTVEHNGMVVAESWWLRARSVFE